jgi:uncharacterized ferritin-like protein (DUF455 family)
MWKSESFALHASLEARGMPATIERMSGNQQTVHAAAFTVLMTADPAAKVTATASLLDAWRGGLLGCGHSVTTHELAPAAIPVPGRPPRPVLVSPRDLAQRPLGTVEGRIALMHAVAHIEFNAINLALDAVYRWPEMPREFHDDWLTVAADEARHFSLLAGRLIELGAAYGDLPAHDGLWEMAVRTAGDPVARMALVPRVLEARGLDVTPGMIERLRRAGDGRTVELLEVILAEEVAHVAAGTRWFHWLCARESLEPEQTFFDLLASAAPGALRGPFNITARRRAGFSEAELRRLEGHNAAITAESATRGRGAQP